MEKIGHVNEMSSNKKKSQSAVLLEIEPKNKSDYRIIRDAGFKSMYHFMLSHNLKIHDNDDYQHAKQIPQAFREGDQEEYEARKGEESKRK